MSNAVMETHSNIFVTIDKLVSPSSSVNWNPLDDFPDHWQPRFSAQFPPPGTSGGADWPAPSERKMSPVLLGKTGPSSRGICGLARGTRETTRPDVYSQAVRQLDALRTAWAAFVFAGSATGSSLSSFSALTQSSTSFPCSPPR